MTLRKIKAISFKHDSVYIKVDVTSLLGLRKWLLLGSFILMLTGCGGGGGGNESQPRPNPSEKSNSIALKPIVSDAALIEQFSQSYLSLHDEGNLYVETLNSDSPAADSSGGVGGQFSRPQFSRTNVQEAAVDESDIWKFNGNYLYVSTSADIQVMKYEDQALEAVSSIPLDRISEDLHLEGQGLTVISSSYSEAPDSSVTHFSGMSDIGLYPIWNTYTHVDHYDVSALEGGSGDAQKEWEMTLEGSLLADRRIGQYLYLVTQSWPTFHTLNAYPTTEAEVNANADVLAQLEVSDLIPQVNVNGVEQPLVKAESCYSTDLVQESMTVITTLTRIDLASGEFLSRCTFGYVEDIYVSENTAYLYRTEWLATLKNRIDFPQNALFDNSQYATIIHGFALDENLIYSGSAMASGLLSCYPRRFCLGELSDGRLGAVVSLEYEIFSSDDVEYQLQILELNNTTNSDYGLIATLPNEAHPEPIGEFGEVLYSARFMQNRLYLVTFDQVDPLYVIDLSDTENPVIAGELEIPGVSDYLHPVEDSLVIGVGKDAKVGASGTTWFQGVKVSVFDVSDMASPTEIYSKVIGKRGSSTAVGSDHRAFSSLLLEDQYRFALPVSVHEEPSTFIGIGDPEREIFDWSYTALFPFEIDMPKEGTAKVYEKSPVVSNQRSAEMPYDDGYYRSRSVLLEGGGLYLPGMNKNVIVFDWN
ncbi:beta-propeller domain-containing protein [Marinibactrum halimedae]|uniref:Beta propeller domain-containing protein n=1 Tax=Marinibactrum halimedae TaxID=1444977 RepID=A0AA37T6Z2_9GAMM|nr:beta-propeller domain-containing protein [Marinibactrum halimedae]MCD9457600.1 beta-propeller domain-containing protein [Marinibactrum halimedae]GLS28019.1 hypothetical protein GCM10007877_37380 [Marinibactrum halimedae]